MLCPDWLIQWTLSQEVWVQDLARSLYCVLGQNTFLPQCLSPPVVINWLPILLGGKILLSHFMLRKLGWAATGWAPGTDVLYWLFSFLNDSMSPHGVQRSCLLPCTLVNIIWVIGPAILCVFCLLTFLTRKDDSWCFAGIMIITL